MKKKQEKMQDKDLFSISKGSRRGMVVFLVLMTLIWMIPIYSLVKDSLKVNGIQNYVYVLTKIEFTGGKWIYSMVVMCLAISGPILIIPLFYIYKTAHLYNTHLAVILSECLITIPFGVLMMKNFFDGLPGELMESANVDGANIVQTYFKIYLPLAKPAVINLVVLQLMWSFQDFLFPLMFLTRDQAYTTTVAVNAFKGAYGMSAQSLGRYNAALVLISIPTILIFVFAQKYIVNGVTSGAVKE